MFPEGRIVDFLIVGVVALIAATAEATAGALVQYLPGKFDFDGWRMWVACDYLGVLLATPAVLKIGSNWAVPWK